MGVCGENRVWLPVPRAGEKVWVKVKPGIAPCVVVGYSDVLLLRPEFVVDARVGDHVVLKRRKDGQEFFFEEQVVDGKPFAISCSTPVVVREYRYRVELPCRWRRPGGAWQEGKTVDLSRGGLKAGSWLPGPTRGEQVEVEVELPSGVFRSRGVVAWLLEWIDGWPWFGVKFAGADPDAVRELEQYLAFLLGEEVK